MVASAHALAYAETRRAGRAAAARRPVLRCSSITGTADRCQPQERFDTVAELTGAERLVIEGGSHLPMGRDPVVVNRGDQGLHRPGHRSSSPAPVPSGDQSQRPPVLYLSSPIGLGRVRRDLAVADALREQRPDVEVGWLTQSPVMEFLEQRGETVHPASAHLVSESTHFENRESGEHDLHAFPAIRRMDEVLVNNFMVFDDLVAREPFRPLGRRRGLGPGPLPAREPPG